MSNLWEITSILPNQIDLYSLYIFRIDLSPYMSKSSSKPIFPNLSQSEEQRMNDFYFDKDRYLFGTARYVLRSICSNLVNTKADDIQIDFLEYGKPFFPKFNHLQFNISHSGNIILLGFGINYPLGVDVEIYSNTIDHLKLSKSVFSKKEVNDLHKLEDTVLVEGFYNCWTKKESYIKARGLGLHLALDGFSVRLFDEGNYNLSHTTDIVGEPQKWQLFNFPVGDHYAAACTCDRSIQNIKYLDISNYVFDQISLKNQK